MYKLKTRRSAIKRYKSTANNKYIRKRSFRAHLLQKKSSSRKRRLAGQTKALNAEYLTVKKFFNK